MPRRRVEPFCYDEMFSVAADIADKYRQLAEEAERLAEEDERLDKRYDEMERRLMEMKRRTDKGITNPGKRNRPGCVFPDCSCDDPWRLCSDDDAPLN